MENPICWWDHKLSDKCCDSRWEECKYYKEVIDEITKKIVKICTFNF